MDMIAFDRFVLDPRRRVLLAGGQPVDLQSRPFDILLFLVSERDRVVSRDEIMAHVWQGQVVAESNLTVQMSILRRTLADCGASGLIITVPGRGYRFVADVAQAPDAPTAAPARRQLGPLLVCVMTVILAGSAWRYGVSRFTASPLTMRALVRVEVDPDIVTIMPDGVTPVNYLFTVENQVDLQLETEDVQYYLTTGAAVGPGNVGGRIWRGSFPIRGGTTGVYHNHIWLPPEVAAFCNARSIRSVQLKHIFHLRDVTGYEVTVPAVLTVLIGQTPLRDAGPD
jgi:DNA-binding winged helix-turn-helix (wHTH) protein